MSNIFTFPIVEMAANYAKIEMVGSLDAVFQQVPLAQISEIFTKLLWNISYLKSVKESKTYF